MFTVDDSPNLTGTHPKLPRECHLTFSRVARSDRAHLCRTEFGIRVVSAAVLGAGVSPLPGHVGHVVCMSAEEQMGGIDAIPRIASGAVMADIQAFWDRPVRQLPRDTVSFLELAINPNDSITAGVEMTSPQPTRIGLLHLQPEPLCERKWRSAFKTTEFLALQTGWEGGKRDATASTDDQDTATTVKSGRLYMHRMLTPFGAMPPAVTAARRLHYDVILPSLMAKDTEAEEWIDSLRQRR